MRPIGSPTAAPSLSKEHRARALEKPKKELHVLIK